MRPLLVLWLSHHGLPVWRGSTYFLLAVISASLGGVVTLRLARAAREDLGHEARALSLACLGALFGGYALEALRALPMAASLGALAPGLQVGRAAYGGLLFSLVLAVSYRVKHQLSIAAFLDRLLLGAGVAFVGGRLGSFLTDVGERFGNELRRGAESHGLYHLDWGPSSTPYLALLVGTGIGVLLTQRCLLPRATALPLRHSTVVVE